MQAQSTQVSVMNFKSFEAYFTAYMTAKRTVFRRFSYEWLRQRLKIKSRASLAMIASGERRPSVSLLMRMKEEFGWSEEEYLYAVVLALHGRVRRQGVMRHAQDELSRRNVLGTTALFQKQPTTSVGPSAFCMGDLPTTPE